jgi:hypothetical protein
MSINPLRNTYPYFQMSLWPLFFGLSESVDLSTKNLHNARNGFSPRLWNCSRPRTIA